MARAEVLNVATTEVAYIAELLKDHLDLERLPGRGAFDPHRAPWGINPARWREVSANQGQTGNR